MAFRNNIFFYLLPIPGIICLILFRLCFPKHTTSIIMQGEYGYNRDEQKQGTWKRAYKNEWQYV